MNLERKAPLVALSAIGAREKSAGRLDLRLSVCPPDAGEGEKRGRGLMSRALYHGI